MLDTLARGGTTVEDADQGPDVRSPDPDDDYHIALANVSRSVLVWGDADLLGLSGQIPVRSPAEFLTVIDNLESNPT